MGRIITVASGKGGSSKSTIVTLLAATLAAQRYSVAVVDADPNACFANWHKLYEGARIDCTCEIRHEEIVDHAQEKASVFEVVLIDTAGFGNTTAAFAAGTADLVVIPVMPDRASPWKPCEPRVRLRPSERPAAGIFRFEWCVRAGTFAGSSSERL